MACPKHPATSNREAIDLNIHNSNKFHEVLQGSITDTVSTCENLGDIPSVRKALHDAAAYKVPVAWSEGATETDLLQPRILNNFVYVPLTVPAAMIEASLTGVWRLYTVEGFFQSAAVSAVDLTGGETEVTVSFGYVPLTTTLFVYRNGVLLRGGGVDYTETDPTKITLTEAGIADDQIMFVKFANKDIGTADASNVSYTTGTVADELLRLEDDKLDKTEGLATVGTLAGLKAKSYSSGLQVATKGYHTAGDFGHGAYLIKTAAQASADGDLVDEITNVTIANSNIAVLQPGRAGISVRQSGAKGDGITDDYTSIQSSIRSAFYSGCNKVYVPSGHFVHSLPFALWSNIEFYGTGFDSYLENINDGVTSKTHQASFLQGYYSSARVDDVAAEADNNSYSATGVTAGAYQVVIPGAGDIDNFAVNQIVFLHNGVEKQYGAGAYTREELECRRVEEVSGTTIRLDKPLALDHSTLFVTISGKAQIQFGTAPADHYLQILDKVHIHDIRLKFPAFNGVPGGCYDSVYERVYQEGPFGYSVNQGFSSKIRNNLFKCGLRAVELALTCAENEVYGNTIIMTDEYLLNGTDTGAYYDLWCNQGARDNLIHDNEIYSSRESRFIFDGGVGGFGETAGNSFYDNVKHATGVASRTQSIPTISAAFSSNSVIRDNVQYGGTDENNTQLTSATGFLIENNSLLVPAQNPNTNINFNAPASACIGQIRNNIYPQSTFDVSGLADSVLTVDIAGNHHTTRPTTITTHPLVSDTYEHHTSFSKAVSTFTDGTDSELTIFSNTVPAYQKRYDKYQADFVITDTIVPTTDKTIRLYDGATLLSTLTMPSAFGRARTKVDLEVWSVNDATLWFSIVCEQMPFSGSGATARIGYTTSVATSGATVHQPKITVQATEATSDYSVAGVRLQKIGSAGGAWTA